MYFDSNYQPSGSLEREAMFWLEDCISRMSGRTLEYGCREFAERCVLHPEEISPAVVQRFLEAHPRQMRRAFSRLPEAALADFADALHPEQEPQRYVAVIISRLTRQMIDQDLAITRRIPACYGIWPREFRMDVNTVQELINAVPYIQA